MCLFAKHTKTRNEKMKLIFLNMLLLSLIMHSNVVKSSESSAQLFLVGGGLKSCTSMSLKNCSAEAQDKIKQLKHVKRSNLYQLSETSIERVDTLWPTHLDQAKKREVIALLNRVQQKTSTLLTLTLLEEEIRKYDRNRLFSKLSNPEYYTLLDLLEQPNIDDETGERLKEFVNLAESNNVFSTNIYKMFVDNAKRISGNDTAKIVVITASSRDIFEAVDFYHAAFTQAGANTQWLPLDATLNTLMQTKGNREDVCKSIAYHRSIIQGSVNREFVYPDLAQQQMKACLTPELILEAIESADGVFLNGGDQSLTLKAFINKNGTDSPVLKMIKAKLKKNELIIGGTSAGTAVMAGGVFDNAAIPMITNGRSGAAIIRGAKKDQLPIEGCHKSLQCDHDLLNDDLTYNSSGGLGLFNWGITDTHFSERGRQGRLSQLVIDTNVSYGFGVDEATALIVEDAYSPAPQFKVFGQGGVFIVEHDKKQKKGHHVTTHFLGGDDKFTLSKEGIVIDIARWKKNSTESFTFPGPINDVFDGSRYQKAAELLCRTSASQFVALDQFESKKIYITVSKTNLSQSRYGVARIDGKERDYCSYQNVNLTITTKR